MKETRLFFVSQGANHSKELHETAEEATDVVNEYSNTERDFKAHVFICLVRNAYRENDKWNYEDLSNTFTEIQQYI